MMGKTSVELLIFDLDGTLIESKWDIAASVNLTLVELGLPQRPIEEIFGFVGDGVKQLLRLSVGEGGRGTFDEALRVFRAHYLAHCLDHTTFYPGVGEMLAHFAGKQKAVATNKSIEYTNVILQGLGANHFH
jgi:phosphoglycolate phosphatase